MAAADTGQTKTPTWQLDPAHSSVDFSVKHMMMTTVRGHFRNVHATLTGDRDHAEAAGVEATIEVGSIDTGVAERDTHLRSADFFDAERFPRITFRLPHLPGKLRKRSVVLGDAGPEDVSVGPALWRK
jgi:polyisoprenoid-binding protein YceI